MVRDLVLTGSAVNGTNAFSSHASELHYVASSANTVIEGDVIGDGKTDFQIRLVGTINSSASDFIL